MLREEKGNGIFFLKKDTSSCIYMNISLPHDLYLYISDIYISWLRASLLLREISLRHPLLPGSVVAPHSFFFSLYRTITLNTMLAS
jgi:hypothetical protein